MKKIITCGVVAGLIGSVIAVAAWACGFNHEWLLAFGVGLIVVGILATRKAQVSHAQ